MASWGSSGWSSSGWGSSASSGPTALQVLELMELERRKREGGHGNAIWDIIRGAGKGAGTIIGGIFNLLMRPTWAVASASQEALNDTPYASPLSAAWAGLRGQSKIGFGEVLDESGVLSGHDFTRGTLGFMLDVGLDPTTYAGIFTGPPGWAYLGGRTGAQLGFKGLPKVAAKLGGEKPTALTQLGHKMIHASDDTSASEYARLFLDEWGDTTFDPKAFSWSQDFAARKALADDLLGNRNIDLTNPLNETLRMGQTDMKSMALAEYKDHLRRVGLRKAGVRYKVPFGPEFRTGAKVKLGSAGLGERNIPVLSAGARHLGGTFIPGYGNKVLHAAEINARHRARMLQERYSNIIREAERTTRQSPKAGLLTRKERLEAADWAANKDELVIGRDWENGKYGDINIEEFNRAVRDKELTPGQAEFLSNVVYPFGRKMWEADTQFGIPYEKGYSLTKSKGQLYIPEPYKPKIKGATGGRSRMTEAPFQKIRKASRSYEDLIKAGFSEDELDPLARMLSRSRSAGQKHADAQFYRAATKAFGQPMKLPDVEKLDELTAEVDKLRMKREDLWIAKAAQGGPNRGSLFMGGMNKMVTEELDRLRSLPSVQRGLATRIARIQKAKYPATRKRYEKDLKDYRASLRARAKSRVTNKLYPELKGKHLREDERLAKREVKALKGMDNAGRALNNPNAVLLQDIRDIFQGGKLYMPYKLPDGREVSVKVGLTPEIKKSLSKMEKALIDFEDDEFAQVTLQTYDKFLSRLRMWYTVYNPGYRIRNTVSDLWAMWLSGMSPGLATRWGLKGHGQLQLATKAMDKVARGESITAAEQGAINFVDEAYELGILAGFFEGDAALVRRLTTGGSRKKGHFWKEGWQPKEGAGAFRKGTAATAYPFRAYQEAMVNMNSAVENSTRLGHYMYRRSKGMSPAEAADYVKTRHFDYEDLTTSELRFGKKIALFYTWTRKNLPFQLQQLGMEPGRFSALPKAIMEGEQASGDSEGEVLPDFLKQGFAFKVPGMGYINPAVGATDLRLLPQRLPGQEGGMSFPAKSWMELINPMYRMPWEIISNTNMRTGAPIAGQHPRNPLGPWPAALMENIPLLGSLLNYGPTERRVGKEQVSGPGISPWVSYAAAQVPFLNLPFNQMSNIRQEQRGDVQGPIPPYALSWLFGVSAFDPNQDQMLNVQDAQFAEEMDSIIRGMRDENLIAEPDPQELSDYELLRLALLKSVYGRPGG